MKPLIVANWKMNPTSLAETKRLFNSVKNGIKKIKKAEVVICPPFVYLSTFSQQYRRLVRGTVRLGGQDCFWEEKGAFTGEVSPAMLKNLGCEYVIIGHSERRRYFQETDEMINKKIKAALKVKLKPILCVGETEEERKNGKAEEILKRQIEKDLKEIESFNLIIAYEPVWAIGTGNSCGAGEAQNIKNFISGIIPSVKILYGGSVNSGNSKEYIKEAGFGGLLVGGASLDAEEFSKIIKSCG